MRWNLRSDIIFRALLTILIPRRAGGLVEVEVEVVDEVVPAAAIDIAHDDREVVLVPASTYNISILLKLVIAYLL
jgi:hypothetical protein